MNFPLTDVETARIRAFRAKHLKSCPETGAIGGWFEYCFTPTTIGTFVWVKCTRCEVKEDMTDVEVM